MDRRTLPFVIAFAFVIGVLSGLVSLWKISSPANAFILHGQTLVSLEDYSLAHNVYLPIITNIPPPKTWSGMHLGNRNNSDWSSSMLAPFDATQGGAWPRIVLALSNQVFSIHRDANCRITNVTVRNPNLYNYLRKAARAGSGVTSVMIRIYPSPGNFAQSTDPNWMDPALRPAGRTLLVNANQRSGNWTQCGNDWRFRAINDIGDEIIAIEQYAENDGWHVYGFEPANEPNVEWYAKPHPNGNEPSPALYNQSAWLAMDNYFANLWTYVQTNAGNLTIRVFSPPMAQSAYAETRNVLSSSTPCDAFSFSGYQSMSQTINNSNPKSEGYSWHNYWISGKEAWGNCPIGQHVAMWFPSLMSDNLYANSRAGFITEADLAPPQFNWGNSITDKDTQSGTAAASLRSFLYAEYNQSGFRGADRIGVWLLNDDSGVSQHTWAQAHNGTAFRAWFNLWWGGAETP